MTILIVDDQISVVNSLISCIDFKSLGIDAVFSASSALQAKQIMSEHTVDILLCDIEMPEENGLELNRWALRESPSTLRLLLTCHADFSYAQQSVKLGCFDYIVQPAPLDEIYASLKRAVRRINQDQRSALLSDYGKLYLTNELQYLDRIVYSLYSSHKRNVEEAMSYLNSIGYSLRTDSQIQLVMIDLYPFRQANTDCPSTHEIKKVFIAALEQSGLPEGIHPLITLNRYKTFVILLFSDTDTLSLCGPEHYQRFYDYVAHAVSPQISCYVGRIAEFTRLREEVLHNHAFIDDNVAQKPGLYFCSETPAAASSSDDLPYKIGRWEKMICSGHKNIALKEIIDYLDAAEHAGGSNFRSLCTLHQNLTQIFFRYLYDNKLQTEDLFSEDYTYSEYMDAFKSISALKRAVIYVIESMGNLDRVTLDTDNVELAKTWIMSNISKNITVKEVADYVHHSPEYFTKLFKKSTGMNIKDYILLKKIEVAKDLLENSNLSVSMIALEVGYSNFSHFTQLFKKLTDTTPTLYREHHQARR